MAVSRPMTDYTPGVLSQEYPGLGLVDKHIEHLKSSAISIEVIKERGYKTVQGKTPLSKAGFSPAQQKHIPGILIPLHGVDGGIVGYQYKPDHPRMDARRERPIKYENPAGASVRLDCPPRCRVNLGNPSIPIWITEGVKKVDALASAGCCSIGLTGVYGFKGRNEFGGVTVLADFDHIAWKDRPVYLVFDSDSATNPHVGKAMERLTEILSRKGAKVRILQLPHGADGAKVGADDYLAQGGTVEALLSLERLDAPEETPREKPHGSYKVRDGKLCRIQRTANGTEDVVPLCNFSARITEEVTRDNGLDVNKFFKISGRTDTGIDLPFIEVHSKDFSSMNWVVSEWGVKAVITAGQNSKDRLREALQLMSEDAISRHIYTHTGWRHIGESDAFLSAGGAIGADGVDVELESQLARYTLPLPIEDNENVKDFVETSLDFLHVGELSVTLPLWASMYLAPLSEAIEPTFTLWIEGPSGSLKSAISALAIRHFGDFDYKSLPASWRDTQNTLEKLLFLCKDIPLVVDDWAPGQNATQARELEAKAEYVVRAQGNRQGRGRMRSDTSMRANYIPRGMLITSGEQMPSGCSHNARIFPVQIEYGDVKRDMLSEAQRISCKYRHAMAHYIKHLQYDWPNHKLRLRAEFNALRDELSSGATDVHLRLSSAIACLLIGLREGLNFAVSVGAISESAASALLKDGRGLFLEAARAQGNTIQNESPAIRLIEALRETLASGTSVLHEHGHALPDTSPGKTLLGWKDSNKGVIYLIPSITHGFVCQHYQRGQEPFTWKRAAVWKDLQRRGMLVCNEGDNPTVSVHNPLSNTSCRAVPLKMSLIEVTRLDAGE